MYVLIPKTQHRKLNPASQPCLFADTRFESGFMHIARQQQQNLHVSYKAAVKGITGSSCCSDESAAAMSSIIKETDSDDECSDDDLTNSNI